MASGVWVRIPSPGTRQRLLLTFGSLAILSLFLWTPVGGITRIVDEAVGPSPLIRVGLPILLALAVLGIAYLIVAERTQPPAVDVARGILRIGRKEWGFSEITGARIELAGGEGDDTLILRLSTTGDESCSVVVSTREACVSTTPSAMRASRRSPDPASRRRARRTTRTAGSRTSSSPGT